MTRIFSIAILMALLIAPVAAGVERSSVHFVIAIGAVPPDVATGVIDETVAALRPGDSLSVMTLEDQQLVGRIVLPANRRINDRARELRYGEQRDVIKAALSARGAPLPSAPTRWPQGLAELGKLIEPGLPDRNIHVLVLDAALYNDPAEPRLSMRTGYPNGALVAGPQTLSPFGTADRKGRLRGIRVHFCRREEPKDFVNDLHQQRVEGAIAQFVTLQSGTLATFTNATRLCVDRFLAANQTGSIVAPSVDAGETPAMVQLKPRAAAIEIAKPKPADNVEIRPPAIPTSDQPSAAPAQAPSAPISPVDTAAVTPTLAPPTNLPPSEPKVSAPPTPTTRRTKSPTDVVPLPPARPRLSHAPAPQPKRERVVKTASRPQSRERTIPIPCPPEAAPTIARRPPSLFERIGHLFDL